MKDDPRDDTGTSLPGRSSESPESPPVKVVDRRWWATKSETVEDTGTWEPRKPTQIEELERQLAEKNELLQTYMTQYKEAVAEFDDVKARIRRDVSKDVERGRRAILVELVDILDNLERALAAGRDTSNIDALLQGLGMVERLFAARLEAFGVVRIEALGRRFDPAEHEAVSTVPTTDAAQDDTIVGVIRPGYAIGGEVLRPAQVAVAKLA